MSERDQRNRWRCTVTGCNPVLLSQEAQDKHHETTGHRTAKWPIRSKAGKKKARARNRTGYYDKYNVGEKSSIARGLVPTRDDSMSIPNSTGLLAMLDYKEYCGGQSGEDLGQW